MIEPEYPYSLDELRAKFEGASGSFDYQWFVNDTALSVAGEVLDPEYYKKNDSVRVEVTDRETGESFSSSEVIIANSPPQVKEITVGIVAEAEGDGYAFKVLVMNIDVDSDYVTNTFEWTVNGIAVGGNSEILSNKNFSRGEMVAVKVVPNDGMDLGLAKTSKSIRIPNSPPSITSEVPEFITIGGKYSYQVSAVDRDGDPISFELEQAPKGMRIDPWTGELIWESINILPGVYNVNIAASDGTSSGHQVFSMTIE